MYKWPFNDELLLSSRPWGMWKFLYKSNNKICNWKLSSTSCNLRYNRLNFTVSSRRQKENDFKRLICSQVVKYNYRYYLKDSLETKLEIEKKNNLWQFEGVTRWVGDRMTLNTKFANVVLGQVHSFYEQIRL